jgi:hypothetical protein
LLSGKLNDDFKISPPKFAQVIEKIKIERSLKNRQNAAKRIFSVFEIKEFPNPDFVKEVKQVITGILNKDNSVKKSFLYHLITYDKTPSFLPPGNAEFFAKVGLIAINAAGYDEQVFKNGPFYKACITYKGVLNTNTASSGLKKYFELPDEDLKSSHKKMVELISENHKGLEVFKIAYFFLAMKSYLLKHDNNLVLIYNNIIEELEQDKTTALHVLYLIGYTFSFEQLYEGLHTLDRAPLLERIFLRNTIKKKEEAIEEIIDVLKEDVIDIKKDFIVIKDEIAGENIDIKETIENNEEVNLDIEVINESNDEIYDVVEKSTEYFDEMTIDDQDIYKMNVIEELDSTINKDKLTLIQPQTDIESNENEIKNNLPEEIVPIEQFNFNQNEIKEPEISYGIKSVQDDYEDSKIFEALKQFVIKEIPTTKMKDWEMFFESCRIENATIQSYVDFYSKLQFYSKYDKLKPSKKLLEGIEIYFQKL